MELRQRNDITIRQTDIEGIYLSIPHWESIAQEPANAGFIRHGVDRAVTRMPQEYKIPYSEHAKPFLAHGSCQSL
jgi:hypothetical protein